MVRLVCFAVCEYTGITLTRYMCEIARANPGLQDLEALISSIQTACKTINSLVQRAHITGLVGYADGGGSINVQGEEQKTLDILTNDVLKKALRFTGKMGVIASEEEDNPVDGTPMRRSSTATRGHRTLLIWPHLAGGSTVSELGLRAIHWIRGSLEMLSCRVLLVCVYARVCVCVCSVAMPMLGAQCSRTRASARTTQRR